MSFRLLFCFKYIIFDNMQTKMVKDLGTAIVTSLQNLSVRFYEVIFLLKVRSHMNTLDST